MKTVTSKDFDQLASGSLSIHQVLALADRCVSSHLLKSGRVETSPLTRFLKTHFLTGGGPTKGVTRRAIGFVSVLDRLSVFIPDTLQYSGRKRYAIIRDLCWLFVLEGQRYRVVEQKYLTAVKQEREMAERFLQQLDEAFVYKDALKEALLTARKARQDAGVVSLEPSVHKDLTDWLDQIVEDLRDFEETIRIRIRDKRRLLRKGSAAIVERFFRGISATLGNKKAFKEAIRTAPKREEDGGVHSFHPSRHKELTSWLDQITTDLREMEETIRTRIIDQERNLRAGFSGVDRFSAHATEKLRSIVSDLTREDGDDDKVCTLVAELMIFSGLYAEELATTATDHWSQKEKDKTWNRVRRKAKDRLRRIIERQ